MSTPTVTEMRDSIEVYRKAIAELIAALQALPQEAEVLIEQVSEMDGDKYLAEVDSPDLRVVDPHNVSWPEPRPGSKEVVVLK